MYHSVNKATPLSCYTTLSCQFRHPIDRVNKILHSTPWEKLFPSVYVSSKFITGDMTKIGSLMQSVDKSGTISVIRVTSISDDARRCEMELVSSIPSTFQMRMQGKLKEVTYDNSTIWSMTVLYSEDSTPKFVEEMKKNIMCRFTDLEKALGGGLCRRVSSCVVPKCTADQLYDLIKYSPEKLFSTQLKSRTFEKDGCMDKVNSCFTETYCDGSKWKFRVSDVSDLKRTMIAELIETDKNVSFTSMMMRCTVKNVTMPECCSLFEWEHCYSSDVTPKDIECANSHINQYMASVKTFFLTK